MWDGVRRKAVACAFALLVSGAALAPAAFAQEAAPVVEADRTRKHLLGVGAETCMELT